MATKTLIGEKLLRMGVVTQQELHTALDFQKKNGAVKLLSSLVASKKISEEIACSLLGEEVSAPYVSLTKLRDIPESLLALVPRDFATKNKIIPFAKVRNKLLVASSNLRNLHIFDEIGFRTNLHVEPYIATDFAISQALAKYYQFSIPAYKYSSFVSAAKTNPAIDTVPPAESPGFSDIFCPGDPLPKNTARDILFAFIGEMLQTHSFCAVVFSRGNHVFCWSQTAFQKISEGRAIASTRVLRKILYSSVAFVENASVDDCFGENLRGIDSSAVLSAFPLSLFSKTVGIVVLPATHIPFDQIQEKIKLLCESLEFAAKNRFTTFPQGVTEC